MTDERIDDIIEWVIGFPLLCKLFCIFVILAIPMVMIFIPFDLYYKRKYGYSIGTMVDSEVPEE